VAFAEKTAEAKVASLKAVEPKLQAFYNSLDEKQKKAFDTGRRVGGILNWLRNKRRANFKQRPGSKEQSRRQCQVPNGFALNPDAVIPKGTGAVELAVGGSPPLYPPPCACPVRDHQSVKGLSPAQNCWCGCPGSVSAPSDLPELGLSAGSTVRILSR